jgi:hypothetical protein
MPLAGESSVLDIRFEAPSAHWAAAFLRLPLEAVQPDLTRRAAQMAGAGVGHTAPVALSDLDRPSAVLTRNQWAIASRVDGTLSPRDLARQSGLSLYETVTSLGALIRRGLCAPNAPESPAARRPASATPAATASSNGTARPDDAGLIPAEPAAAGAGPAISEHSAPRYSDPLMRPAAAAQPAGAAAVPPVRPAPDEASPARQPEVVPARPLGETATRRWPHGRPAAAPVTSAEPAAPAVSVATADPAVPAARASWTGGASRAARGSNGSPPERRPFTPAAAPTPLTPSTPAATPALSGATPDASAPVVNPAPVDVPSGPLAGPDSPLHLPYRRPTRRPWPESEAPVSPATLAGHTPAGHTPAGHTPAGQTPADETPAAPGPAAQPPASTRREPAGAYTARAPQPPQPPQSPRPARGAHRADRAPRPEVTRRPDHETNEAEAPDPPASLPSRRRPISLPQRQPGRLLAGAQYTATESRSYTAAQSFSAVAEDWPQPASFGQLAEPVHPPDHPSAPLPATPPVPARSGGGAESEDFAPAAPDLLRRVLDGLRRLA